MTDTSNACSLDGVSRVIFKIDGGDMGVTGNAQYLLGLLTGRIASEYDLVDLDPVAGWVMVQRRDTPNRYRITVLQIEGME